MSNMTPSNIFSLEAPTPSSIKTHRTTSAGGTQHPINTSSASRTSSPPSSPPKYSKSHLARSRSSSLSEATHNVLHTPRVLNTSSLPPSSPRSQRPSLRLQILKRRLSSSSVAHIQHRSQSPPENVWAASNAPPNQPNLHYSIPQKPWSRTVKERAEHANPLSLPASAPVLPPSAYNYEPYDPPPPPPVHPWTRKQLYSQIVNPSPPAFLSCNLTNPVHLASILAHGCSPAVVETVAENMTPATLCDSVGASKEINGVLVEGVLVGGLREEVLPLLEGVFRRRFGGRYERIVREVDVRVEDGGVVVVPAYVYRQAQA